MMQYSLQMRIPWIAVYLLDNVIHCLNTQLFSVYPPPLTYYDI